MIGDLGGPAAADAYDFEATKWVPLYEGEYAVAKLILAKLEEFRIPNQLTFPDEDHGTSSIVLVMVMKRFLAQARKEAVAPVLTTSREGNPNLGESSTS